MLIDADDLESHGPLQARVAVVGAGPAGITLALELARAGHDVLLLESGRPGFDPRIQALAETPHFDPDVHAPMREVTRRQVGGASVIWGGRCVPFDPVDFDERPWIPEARWPVTYDEIARFFQRACDWLLCGRAVFDARQVPTIRQPTIVPGLPEVDVRTSTLERWSLPTNFGRVYRRELAQSPHVRLVHGLTCTEVQSHPSRNRVAGLQAKTLHGKPVSVLASHYVLACGGLETARLLLVSDRLHPGGIGNHSGLLGRYYMGHLSGRIAQVEFHTPPTLTAYGFERDVDGVYVRRRFSFTREAQHREGLTNIVGFLVNPDIRDPSHRSGILSLAYLALRSPWVGPHLASEAIRSAALGEDRRRVGPHLRNIARDSPRAVSWLVSFGLRRLLSRRKIPAFYTYSPSNTYPLHYFGEQVPNPASRVTLAEDVDALGMRRLHIDLRFSPQDVDGVLRGHRLWDACLRGHSRGRLQYLPGDPEAGVWRQVREGAHQAGVTRMSASPDQGVVAPDCRVHGFDDLFVASSSIFPTSGQAGSTLMILAFALRLADQLKARLQTSPRAAS